MKNATAIYLVRLSISRWHVNGEVAEWSKAAALGAALFGGVGSNPIFVKALLDLVLFAEVLFKIYITFAGSTHSLIVLSTFLRSENKPHF